MNMAIKKSSFRPGEFKARLPYLDKIPSHILLSRFEHGVSATLRTVASVAQVLGPVAYNSGDKVKEAYKADTRSAIAACNYSASQVAKELKARGVAVPK